MTHSQLDLMLAESQVESDEANELRDLLAPLTEVATEAPEPSAELQALFEETGARGERARVLPLGRRRRGRGAVAGAVVLALSGVGATGLSAAANTLPRPLQHQVSKFSQAYLPFRLPEPAARSSRRAPHAAQAPKPGSASGSNLESREVGQPAATRSLGQPRRTIKGAAAWLESDSRRGDEAGAKPSAEQSTYSKPRASAPAEPRPTEEPRSVESEMSTSKGSGTPPDDEPRQGWAHDGKRGPDDPGDRAGEPPAKHDDKGKDADKPDPRDKGGSSPKDKHEQPGKSKPGGGGPVSPNKDKSTGDPGADGEHQDPGPTGDRGGKETGPDTDQALSPVTRAVDVLVNGHNGA